MSTLAHPATLDPGAFDWAIAGTSAMAFRQPVGVVGAIAPWNAPLNLPARSIAAPLAFGNTAVFKPSEWSPVSGGLLWGEVFAEAGLPPGVLNIVTHAPGEAAPIADELVEHPAVRRLNFTGSTATGRTLAEAAGRHLKRIVLELGGFNPLIVLADADLAYAVDAACFGAFLHQGQICMSARQILVERPIAAAFVERNDWAYVESQLQEDGVTLTAQGEALLKTLQDDALFRFPPPPSLVLPTVRLLDGE